MPAGRPRQHETNADRQRAYRQRLKRPKALRNSLEEIQRQLDNHNAKYNPVDPCWIDESTRLFMAYQKARRAVLLDEQDKRQATNR